MLSSEARLNFLLNTRTLRLNGLFQVKLGLQIEPRPGIAAKIAGQAQRGIRRDAPPLFHNFKQTGGRNPQRRRQCVDAQAQGDQKIFAQNFAGMDRTHSIRITERASSVVMMTRLKAFKFRFYPTADQRQQLAIEFGNAWFVWNRGLDWRSKAWEERQERHNYVSLGRQVTEWKRGEFPWLADSAVCGLTQVLIDQDQAFKNFFEKRGRYPRFKSRYDRQAVRYQLDQRQIERTWQAGEVLKLPKLGALNMRWSQVPAGVPKRATVSKTPDGRYFVSFACEVALQPLPLTGKAVGLDVGIKEVVVSWDGERATKSGNPRHLKSQLRHLKRQQRRLSRMQKGSQRRRKQRVKVAKIHAHIAALRADFLHKTTTALVKSADVIVLEDLHVKGMVKNHHLVGVIADVDMGELRRQIEYKADWNGRTVVVVDRWFPSSKTCSDCGSYQQQMPLRIREWMCPDCGTRHNILKFSTAGEAGRQARGASQNLSGHVSLTYDEARTEPECHRSRPSGTGRVDERRGFQKGSYEWVRR